MLRRSTNQTAFSMLRYTHDYPVTYDIQLGDCENNRPKAKPAPYAGICGGRFHTRPTDLRIFLCKHFLARYLATANVGHIVL